MKTKATSTVRKLTDSEVASIRTLARTVIGWTRLSMLLDEIQPHGCALDKKVNWRANFDKILRRTKQGRIRMQDYHREILRRTLRKALCDKFNKTDDELDAYARSLLGADLAPALALLRRPSPANVPGPHPNAIQQQATLTTTPFPDRVLTTKRGMPQWADHWVIPLNGGALRSIKCKVDTSSAHFRFGLKLLTSNCRVFGDAAIQSQEATNLLIHIGRDNSERPGLSSKDVFLTAYENGVGPNSDQKLWASGRRLQASVSLSIEDGPAFSFSVNGSCCCMGAIPLDACYRLVMFAWGDREEYEIKVSEIEVITLK